MGLRNTSDSYGWLARLLHWSIAILLVGLVWAGLTFNGMERGPDRSELAGLHKSFALLLLILMSVRLVWRLMNPRPEDPPGMPIWQRTASLIAHWAMYAAVFFQLVIGLLVSGERPIGFFGLFEFGPFLDRNEEMHELFEELHEAGWIVLAVLVGVHVLAGLYHHFVMKDNVLKRMTTG